MQCSICNRPLTNQEELDADIITENELLEPMCHKCMDENFDTLIECF